MHFCFRRRYIVRLPYSFTSQTLPTTRSAETVNPNNPNHYFRRGCRPCSSSRSCAPRAVKLLGSAFSVRLNDCLENTSSEDSKAVRERERESEREREREGEREREREGERERERETQTERERECRNVGLLGLSRSPDRPQCSRCWRACRTWVARPSPKHLEGISSNLRVPEL